MSPKAPIVFVQYIMGLAVVEAVRSRPGYEDIPLRLKWPNDIYADASLLAAESSAITDRIDTSSSPLGSFVKIGGVLVTSSFENNQFTLLIGTGVNTNNAMPTTSINQLITAYSKQHGRYLEPISMEDMLASILQSFENFYRRFLLS
ncbi:biotin holocarboxylase synthetase, partial [Spiromyces aspiralis]